MADRYLLESGAPDGILNEDGSGVLLLESQAAANPSTFGRKIAMAGIVAAWSMVVAVPLFASVTLQQTLPSPPPPRHDAVQAVVHQSWRAADWPTQVTRKAPAPAPVAAKISSRHIESIFANWEDTTVLPYWEPTLFQEGEEAPPPPGDNPPPKRKLPAGLFISWEPPLLRPVWGSALTQDAPQPYVRESLPLILSTWQAEPWSTQVTRKLPTSGPVVQQPSHTDAGQSVIRLWPQPDWPSQVTRKLSTSGPVVPQTPKTDAGQASIRQWPQPDWASQTTRKVSTSGPVQQQAYRRDAFYTIADRWNSFSFQPIWMSAGVQQAPAVVTPDNPPPKPQLPAGLLASWEPTPLIPAWGFRQTQDAPQPRRSDMFWAIADQWLPREWPTQVTRKVPTSAPIKTSYSRAAESPIFVWELPDWPTQVTRKLTTSAPIPTPFSRAAELPISIWQLPDWPAQTTKKLPTSGPEIVSVPKTDWGQSVVRQWPTPEWPSQINRKSPIPDAVVTGVPFTRQASQPIAQWPPVDWSSQATRKTSTGVPEPAPPLSRASSEPIAVWQPLDWPTQTTHKLATSGPELSLLAPFVHASSAPIAQWMPLEWPTQTTRHKSTSAPIKTPFSHAAYLAITIWQPLEWPSQTTRKVAESGPEIGRDPWKMFGANLGGSVFEADLGGLIFGANPLAGPFEADS